MNLNLQRFRPRSTHRHSPGCAIAMFLACLAAFAQTASAHLLVDNAMDVVIGQTSIKVDVRISLDEVTVVEAHGLTDHSPDEWNALTLAHRQYVLSHLHFRADGVDLVPSPQPENTPAGTVIETGNSSQMAEYKIEYPLDSPPALVQIYQNFLEEYEPSDASFTIRIRQSNQPEFETSQLHRDGHADFDCRWTSATSEAVGENGNHVDYRATAMAFLKQGVWHILTGYDHLLFVSGLVLAATSLWDLVKVVGAFTLAHSITLTLCVFNVVNLSSHIVEPMISTSIMLIALQNIFWPRNSTGWARIGIAFGFGLFHGLGFAGGLKDAMSELPSMALWLSLISFSIGVELGHQVVVLPLYAILRTIRKYQDSSKNPTIMDLCRRYGSCFIFVAGGYFLYQALQF